MEIQVDMSNLEERLTLGDVELLDKEFGVSFAEFSEGSLSGPALVGIVHVLLLKDNPDQTPDDTRALPLTVLQSTAESLNDDSDMPEIDADSPSQTA